MALSPWPTFAATFTVDSALDAVDANPGDGVCATAIGDCTFRAAVAEANAQVTAGALISVPAAAYELDPSLGTVEISRGCTISGSGAPTTTIDGSGLSAVLSIATSPAVGDDVTISGITIRHGQTGLSLTTQSVVTLTDAAVADNSGSGIDGGFWVTLERTTIARNLGGGIRSVSRGLHVTDSTIADNVSPDDGGGINAGAESVSISNTSIVRNVSGGSGGGVYVSYGRPRSISHSVVASNQAALDGGGLYVAAHAPCSISDSTFESNIAAGQGGGVVLEPGSGKSISRVAVTRNHATDGGGLVLYGSTSITNTTLSGNIATGKAGGVLVQPQGVFGCQTGTFDGTTITDNSSGVGAGGALFFEARGPDCEPFQMHNSIVFGNHAGDDEANCAGEGSLGGDHNLIGASECAIVPGPGNLIGVDPQLASLRDNGGPTETHALAATSPAIDAGGDCGLATDQRGVSRPQGPACDIGAFEFAVPRCAPTPQVGCQTPSVPNKSVLAITDKVRDKNDSLSWLWLKGSPTDKREFGSPDAITGYSLCIYNADSTQRLAFEANVPAGRTCGTKHPKPCWKATKDGFQYQDRTGAADGIRSIVLRRGLEPRKAKIAVVGKGAALGFPNPLTLVPPLTVQLTNTDGRCWEAVHAASH